MPPPIRYPLPTLIALILLGTILWRGEAMSRPLRAALQERWKRVTAGPPIPSSDTPEVIAGPIVRKGLLLRDNIVATTVPNGPPVETIRLRMFVEVYDVWPLQGEPGHYRIGNRRPIGWVSAADFLPWNTRLVVRPFSGSAAEPVLAWSQTGVEVADWPPDQPWSATALKKTLRPSQLTIDRWGVWLSREELLALLGSTLNSSSDPTLLRLRAVLGRLLDPRSISADDLAAARAALPPVVFTNSTDSEAASERLARLNEKWSPEASWGGLSFQFVPLTDLP